MSVKLTTKTQHDALKARVTDVENGKANTAHSHTSSSITDFTEAAQDAAAALLTSGTHTGVTAAYDDANGRVNLTVTGGSAEQTHTHTTAVLQPGESENFTLPLGKTVQVVYVQASSAARVRVYSTSAQRAADASRPVSEYPTGSHGLYFEAVTSAVIPQVSINDTGSNIYTPRTTAAYFRVRNNDTVARAITMTILVIIQEA